MVYPGRTFLACWLAVVLTGTAVGHRHAADATHTHGFGWVVVPGVTYPDALPLDHRHVVLLGIEFGPAGVPADGDTSPGTGSAAGVLAVTQVEPHDVTTGIDLRLAPLVCDGGPTRLASPALPALATFCPLVTHDRSGVLRS